MRKLRLFLALLLLLVLPLQGYAAAHMALLGPDAPSSETAMQMEEGMPCHMADMPQDTGHDTSAPTTEHACVKCPLCALHAGLPLPQTFGLAIAPRHAGPAGTLLAPAMVYLDPPLPVPRGAAA
ncbi:MAG TPA: DUF2946 family protein [Burkholderiales bacterium]|jgi:hypothetical protein